MKRILLVLLIGVLLMSNWKVMVGGVAFDLEDDYGVHINKVMGSGSARSTLSLDRYTLIPGGKVSAVKVQPRKFTLAGTLMGESRANLHAIRQELVHLFSKEVTIRYVGAAVAKEIKARYVGGLEGNFQVEEPNFWERLSLQFVSPDPWWYGIIENSQELDPIDTISYYTISRRLHSVGVWDNMGTSPLGDYHAVLAIAKASDGTIYIGGHFPRFDNNANCVNVAKWNPATSTWQPLGKGLNDVVRGISIAGDGTIVMVGKFTDVAGGPGGTYNRVIRWDPVTSTWSAFGAGLDDDTYTVSTGLDGIIYVGGYFHNPAMHIARWTGAAWSSVGVGLNNEVFASCVGLDGGIYFAGNFNDLQGGPGQTYSRLAKWNPTTSTWTSLTNGRIINGHVNAITVYKNGHIYFGGDFDTIGTEVFNNIGRWNGTSLSTLSTGVDDEVHSLAIGPTGILYVGGRMHTAGGVPVSHLALWNGCTWAYADIALPNIEAVFSSLIGEQDPDVPQNYDVYLGSATPLGSESQAGIITAVNGGTAPVYPVITFTRAGGTSAKVLSVRNETTGKTLYFAYNLQNGETLTVTLAPTSKSIVSSAFGPIPSAILPGSDFGTFALDPGDNRITCFILVSGAPTIMATLAWNDVYRSFD